MAAYKRAPQLENTLASIAQEPSARSFEVVCVEDGYDGGQTKEVCGRFGVRYYCRADRPDVPFSNCAVPINIAIKKARGHVLIIQFPEVKHDGEAIERLVAPHRKKDNLVVLAACARLSRHGYEEGYATHSKFAPSLFFNCGSVLREHVLAVGGFEEAFKFYGYEDDYMAMCLRARGLEFVHRDDITTYHQWHECDHYKMDKTGEVFMALKNAIAQGRMAAVANAGREWGTLINDPD